MSRNAFAASARLSSSASISSSRKSLPRVHGLGRHPPRSRDGGHDHARPLPPPRLSEAPTATAAVTTAATTTTTTTMPKSGVSGGNGSPSSSMTSLSAVAPPPLTAPLAPLSTNSSFRSVASSRNVTIGSGTTTVSAVTGHATGNTTGNSSGNGINGIGSGNGASTTRLVQSSSGGSAPASTGTSTSRAPTSTARSNLGEVTLTVPRPELERVVNEYVETPFRQANPSPGNPLLGSLVTANHQKCLKNERRPHQHQHHNRPNHQHRIDESYRLGQQSQDSQHQQRQERGESGESRKSPTTGRNPGTPQARNRESGGGVAATTTTTTTTTTTPPTTTATTRRQRSDSLQSSVSVATSPVGVGAGGGGGGGGGGGLVAVSGAVTKQPVSFTKEPSNALGSGSPVGPASSLGGRPNDPNPSIMCDFCGRCRCESCRQPPPLPSRWLCDDSCFCSAETALDYASCLCCVKGLFYHCADSGSGTDSEAGGNCADEPCSCTGPRRTARWACLGALTLVLPCLLCYWPLKGCLTVCEACYARHASQGCHCDPNAHGRHRPTPNPQTLVSRDSRDPEKRLLDPVTPEL